LSKFQLAIDHIYINMFLHYLHLSQHFPVVVVELRC
jgi:hypothetical protein